MLRAFLRPLLVSLTSFVVHSTLVTRWSISPFLPFGLTQVFYASGGLPTFSALGVL